MIKIENLNYCVDGLKLFNDAKINIPKDNNVTNFALIPCTPIFIYYLFKKLTCKEYYKP